MLSIFSGTCSTNVEVACDDDGGTLLESQLVSVPLERDLDYLIKVADWGATPETQDGTLTFNLVALPQRGDFDFDCALTIADLAPFETCAQGPDGELPVDDPFGCGLADFDLDGDADLRDFAQLQVQFSIR